MRKSLLRKAIVLSLAVTSFGYNTFAEAGVIAPGTVTGPITLTGGQMGMDTPGTYDFSGGELTINDINNGVGSPLAKVIHGSAGGTSIFNGNLNLNVVNRISTEGQQGQAIRFETNS